MLINMPANNSYGDYTAAASLKVLGQTHFQILECEPMPNVMAVLPNIGGALSSTPQSLADAHY